MKTKWKKWALLIAVGCMATVIWAKNDPCGCENVGKAIFEECMTTTQDADLQQCNQDAENAADACSKDCNE